MKLKRDTKFGEESTCCFKLGVRNLANFNLNTQKSQSTEELSFMTLKSDAKFEEKLDFFLGK